jgi:hypothetical protein
MDKKDDLEQWLLKLYFDKKLEIGTKANWKLTELMQRFITVIFYKKGSYESLGRH